MNAPNIFGWRLVALSSAGTIAMSLIMSVWATPHAAPNWIPRVAVLWISELCLLVMRSSQLRCGGLNQEIMVERYTNVSHSCHSRRVDVKC